MLRRLKLFFQPKKLHLATSRGQKELLELLLINKAEYDVWSAGQTHEKLKLQFFYPSALDFYYDEFKLFTAFFKKNSGGEIELDVMKMTETNYNSIRCNSWTPFEEMILDFLTSMEESKKIALFEKRKALFEYQNLCAKNSSRNSPANDYTNAVSRSSLELLKPTQ